MTSQDYTEAGPSHRRVGEAVPHARVCGRAVPKKKAGDKIDKRSLNVAEGFISEMPTMPEQRASQYYPTPPS